MWQRWLFKRVMDKSSVRLVENYCLYSRNKGATCTACIETCPTDALSFIDGKVKLNQEKCNDCKLCIQPCPTDALYYEEEMLHSYEEKIVARENVCFTCQKQKHSAEDVLVPCISSITPEHLLIALMHDSTVQVFYEPSICKACKYNSFLEEAIASLKEVDYISHGEVQFIHDISEKIGKRKGLTRRELFSVTSTKAKQEVGSLIIDSFDSNLSVKNKLPLPERRRYLSEFTKREKKERYLSKGLAEGLKLTKIKVDDECDLCGRCTHICPTGALKINDEDGLKALTYQAIQCINCEICSHSCSYIERSTDTCLCKGLLQPKVLKSEKTISCPKCGDSMFESQPICADCQSIESKQDEMLSNW